MYCPRCANQAIEGQRFCRHCGMNLGVILDSMEGKQRNPLDFENLKRDLRELGSNLRTGFEEAGLAIKKTKRLDQQAAPAAPVIQHVFAPDWKKELSKAVGKVKVAHTRKYSLQQAMLSLFGGGAWVAVWYQLLNAAAESGLLRSLEGILLDKLDAPIVGLTAVFQLLWMLGLIPMARGVAHLFNGVFFAPKIEKEPDTPPQVFVAPQYIQQPQPYVTPVAPASAVSTNDLESGGQPAPVSSVTEESTLRFGAK